MAESFFFYDYESFGIDTAKDRPAQFGGIRTDMDLNIIGEPIMFYCKQTDDYLPAPDAVMITGITPQLCNEKGMSEPDFAKKILTEFAEPNTCIVGYNNIRYDDEMTRYTLYRNFLDPYAYSWKKGNSRWDLLDVLRACYALRPEGTNWVYDDNENPSFRLELLTQANGISHQNAHDAMADVYATIAMAKQIKQAQPKLYHYLFKLRAKKEVEKLIDTVNLTPLVHVSGMIGAQQGNVTWVVPLAWHPTNKNAVIACDLNANLNELLTLDYQTLQGNLYTKKTVLLEQNKLPVPLKLIHINKCPVIAPPNTLTAQRAEELGIDRIRCQQNLQRLKQDNKIRDKIIDIFEQSYNNAEFNPDEVENALYQGFFSPNDRENMTILSQLTADELKSVELKFQDKRIEALLFHYRARHFYSSLTRAEQIRWQKYRRKSLEDQSEAFSVRLNTLIEENQNNEAKLQLLYQLYEYAERICNA